MALVIFIEDFKQLGNEPHYATMKKWPLWVATLAWILLVIATARPQWWGEPIELPISGRDLMMAVDLSGSMQYEDFLIEGKIVDRLTAIKNVAGQFIERRIGDRLGLILFGEQAYLQTPLTFDRKTVQTLLYESVIGLAGKQTAIGDAIGLAVKRLRLQKTDSRVLILLTDGANTAGEIEPLKAADLAATEALKIYTIGIGADEMVVQSFFGAKRVNPSADLDEKTLKAIANELEPIEQDKQHFRPTQVLYPWPLSLALMLASLLIIVTIDFGNTLNAIKKGALQK